MGNADQICSWIFSPSTFCSVKGKFYGIQNEVQMNKNISKCAFSVIMICKITVFSLTTGTDLFNSSPTGGFV